MDINKLEELARAATPGPWTWCVFDADTGKLPELHGAAGPSEQVYTFGRDTSYDQMSGMEPDLPDMNFIAAANPAAVLDLIALIRKQEAALRESQELVAAQVRTIDELVENRERLLNTIASMQSRMVAKIMAEARDSAMGQDAAAVVTVDTPTIKQLAAQLDSDEKWTVAEQQAFAPFLAQFPNECRQGIQSLGSAWKHGIAYAQSLAAPQQQRIVTEETAKKFLEETLLAFIETSGNFPSIKTDPRAWEHVMVYAPQQHAQASTLLEVIKVLRHYPDFDDADNAYSKMMDQALAGESPELLGSLDCLANGVTPPRSQQHAQAAQPAKQYGLAAYAQANADSRVTGNAQAALSNYSYQQLFNAIAAATNAGGPVSVSVQAFRDHIASQQPAAAPKGHQNCHKCHGNSITHASFCQLFDSRQEQAALAQSSAATPPTPPQEAAARDERAEQESWAHGQIENAAFHKWWEESGQGTEPRHTLLVQNCAHAAWQARAALAVPAAQVAVAEDMLQRTEEMRLEFSNHRMLSRKRLVWMIECLFAHIALAAPAPVLPAAGGDAAAVEAKDKRIRFLEKLVDAYGPKSYRYDIEHPNDGLNATQPSPVQGEALSQQAAWCPECHARESMAVSEFDQGRAAGLEEAAKYWDSDSGEESWISRTIRALNKQEPSA